MHLLYYKQFHMPLLVGVLDKIRHASRIGMPKYLSQFTGYES